MTPWQLRKSGKPQEGYELAKEEKNLGALGWCLYDLIKQARLENNSKSLEKYIKELAEIPFEDVYGGEKLKKFYEDLVLDNPLVLNLRALVQQARTGNSEQAYEKANELMNSSANQNAYDEYAWILYYFAKYIFASAEYDFGYKLVTYYLSNVNNVRPSLVHSLILRLILKLIVSNSVNKNISLSLLNRWNLEYLREEDFVSNNQNYQPLYKLVISCIVSLQPDFEQLKIFYDKIKKGFDNICQWNSNLADVFRHACYNRIYRARNDEKNFNLAGQYFDWYRNHLCDWGDSEYHSKMIHSASFFFVDNRVAQLPLFYLAWRSQGKYTTEDWVERKSDDGKKTFPCFVEHLTTSVFDIATQDPDAYSEVLECLNNDLTMVIEKSHTEWALRRKAKVCVLLGKQEEALTLMKTFLRKDKHLWWAWKDLATLGCIHNKELQTAILCKSVSLVEDNEMTVGRRLYLAMALIEEGLLERAKFEVNFYEELCKDCGWKTNKLHLNLSKQLLETNCPLESNEDFYKERIPVAESYLYEDLPWYRYTLVDSFENKAGKTLLKFVSKFDKFLLVIKSELKCADEALFGTAFDLQVEEDRVFNGRKLNLPLWSALNEGYGIVGDYEEARNRLWIMMPDGSGFVDGRRNLKKGDGVTFRFFEFTNKKGHKQTQLASVTKIDIGNVYQHFHRTKATISTSSNFYGEEMLFWNSTSSYEKGLLHQKQIENLSFDLTDALNVEVIYATYKTKCGENRTKTLRIRSLDTIDDSEFETLF